MLRLWVMTLFGEYRGETETSDGHEDSRPGASATHGHGHGGIHESPKVMLLPLVILAALSIVGGWVGIPGSLGGNNYFDKFLGPVVPSTTTPVYADSAPPGEAHPPVKEADGPR